MKKVVMLTFVMAAMMALGLSACALATDPANNTESKAMAATINVDNFSFSPATLTVTAGTTVTWTNHDDIPHNIVERDQKFKSKALDTDDSYAHTFAEPGTYEYFCGLHPKMVGKVIVEAKK